MISFLLLYVCNSWVNELPSHRLRLLFYRKIMNFTIGSNSTILRGNKFYARGNLIIGDNTIINDHCRIDNRGSISIGNNVSISSETILITTYHDVHSEDFQTLIKDINIEDYVFTGVRATILPGVILRKGTICAAGSVVNNDSMEFDILGGIPARLIGKRSTQLSYKLRYRPWLQ